MTDRALRAEIEAALRGVADAATAGPLWADYSAALLPLVEAQRLAARRDALAEVRADIEALTVIEGDQTIGQTLMRSRALGVLDAAEASQ